MTRPREQRGALGLSPEAAAVSATLLWATASVCWLMQAFVPWTATGALSSSSTLDLLALVRLGVVDALVSPGAVALLVLLPACGVGIGVTAARRAGSLTWLRTALSVVGVAATGLLAVQLTGGQAARLGLGGYLAVAGLLGAVLALALSRLTRDPLPAVDRPRASFRDGGNS